MVGVIETVSLGLRLDMIYLLLSFFHASVRAGNPIGDCRYSGTKKDATAAKFHAGWKQACALLLLQSRN
eukprot:195342-Amphidinium_carterae.1